MAPSEYIKLEYKTTPKQENEEDKESASGGRKAAYISYMKEAKELIHLACPIAISNILLVSITLSTTMVTGRLPKTDFDALSLANAFMITYGQALALGMCTACDTLFSQTMGSQNKKRTGMWLQKSILIINFSMVVVCGIHLNLEPIYLLTGQFPEISKLAAKASVMLSPSIILFANFVILLRYLQNKDIVYVPVFICLIALIYNAIAQYIAISVFGFGFEVAAIIQSTAYALMLIVTIAYIIIGKKYVDTWNGLKREALTSWTEFFVLAICGVGHYAFESVCLNIGIILAGNLDETLLAAQTIFYQLDSTLYTAAFAFSIAVNIRVGRFLGQMQPRAAKDVLKSALFVGFLFVALVSIIIGSTRSYIGYLFTSHQDVIDEITKTTPVIILVFAVDVVRCCVDGTIRGAGRQLFGAAFIIGTFTCIGVPLASYLLMNTDFQLGGFWFGIIVANVVIITMSSIFLFKLNWEKEAIKTQERVLKAYKSKELENSAQPMPNEKTKLLPKPNRIRRMPREPRSCSTNFEEMTSQAEVSDKDFRRLCVLRCLTFVACLCFLVATVTVKTTVPRELFSVLARNITV